jgi:hypothetical protein
LIEPALARALYGSALSGAAGQKKIEIVFDHPQAASPMFIWEEKDDRRLWVSFSRLALVCA